MTPLCAVLMPDEAEVDSEVSELFVLLRPLDSEATLLLVVDSPVESEPMPVDVEVDSEAIELVAELRPVEVDVDSDAIELLADESPVDVEVDKLAIALVVVLMPVLSWATVTASFAAEPSATLVMRRKLVEEPTDTSEDGAALPVK
ncbi:tash protein pest motif family [Burkholderia pseudomallei]|nr:tash protein pest motif family [Burkholderia pseudomallei]CAJ6252101.1 tash protein pest motif family [Burkholderia pseudomallei]